VQTPISWKCTDVSEHHRNRGLLVELAKNVVEAALEAELAAHLVGARKQRPQRGRRNARNGTRLKTVRSLVGPLQIAVPRDRWGTFQPLTVGKWQREVVGVDRVPLAAKGAPPHELLRLLTQAYPPAAAPDVLGRIVESVHAALRDWHERPVEEPFPVLHVHLSTLRNHQGRPACFPVIAVVGVTAPDVDGRERRELLSLHALPCDRDVEAWSEVVSDLRRRGLSGVRSVVGAAAASFRNAAAGLWPSLEEEAVHRVSRADRPTMMGG
jgi:putative transposase